MIINRNILTQLLSSSRPADRNDFAFRGSGPILVQFPSGETVVSYNYSSTFYMKLGDAKARLFGDSYAPFAGKGYWGTLEVIDSHQLIGAMPNTSKGQVMLSKFILNHRVKAVRRSVKVDGDNSEWKNTDEALFVGEQSQAQATLRTAADNDHVYFLAEVLDDFISKDDYATIFISAATSNDVLSDGAYKINISYNGIRDAYTYKNSAWVAGSIGARAKGAFNGTISQNTDSDQGYIVELAIPRSKLNIRSGQVLVNFAISDSDTGGDAIADTAATSTAKWIPVAAL